METRTRTVSGLEADLEKQAKALMEQFLGFTHGTRYLTLLHRSKLGGPQNSEYKRRGGWWVVHTEEEYLNAVVRLLTLKYVASKPYRLYASVNPRNLAKAEKAFKMDMLATDFNSEEAKRFFYERLPEKWVGALMSPGSRDASSFMIDVDGEGDVTAPVLQWLEENKIQPMMQYKTPNGWHIVTPPFNPTNFNVPNAEIKKDGLLLLAA